MNVRFKDCYKIIKLPTGFEEEYRGIKSCCSPCLVLAHPTDADRFKNDLLGVYVKTSDITDVVDITIEDCEGTVLTNFGEVGVFPQDDLAVGFIYDWQQILNNYGIGKYIVKVSFTVSGVTGGFTFGMYELKSYSIENASGTSRVYSKFNSYFQPLNIDFTNSNFEDTVRFNGFFGNRKPKTDIVNLITKGRIVEKATRENLNAYELRTDPVTICVTRRLLDFHFLNEDGCYISDHNRYNHTYELFDKPVVLEESADVEYIDKDRRAKITAIFGDRLKNQKSFYNKQ